MSEKQNKMVRLNSGEEILCNLEDAGDNYVLHDPLIMVPAAANQLGFMPWMPYCSTTNGVTVKKSFIPFIVEPSDQLKKEFTQATSGIIVPEPTPTLNTVGPSLKLTE
jgi:hypothetical protein